MGGCVAIPGATNTPASTTLQTGVGSGNVVWGTSQSPGGTAGLPGAAGTWAASWGTVLVGGVVALLVVWGVVAWYRGWKAQHGAASSPRLGA